MSTYYEELLAQRVRLAVRPMVEKASPEELQNIAAQLRCFAAELEAHRGGHALLDGARGGPPGLGEALHHLIALESRGWASALAKAFRVAAEGLGASS